MKTAIRLAILAACGSLLVACNTAEGVGKDIKAGGKAVEETAKDIKKKL
jgi:entericidin B